LAVDAKVAALAKLAVLAKFAVAAVMLLRPEPSPTKAVAEMLPLTIYLPVNTFPPFNTATPEENSDRMIVTMSPKSYSDGSLNSTSSVRTEFLVGTARESSELIAHSQVPVFYRLIRHFHSRDAHESFLGNF
jgi:hypothetical protein